ncbi:hypothetical protein LZ578_08280 [Jeotgalibaca sp. MA1X17-3]|uniref:hypothetical protein n=1 Tax=Jeotgalibaca sp. MA1X17-3 TaxID=2908211 RepID=UPI001F296597|nr:hypothetical protein [Jeotgalibaca sp. MA1X17-3]UJF15003.1 hypothetical protein LZ578_08280 [Jeotgalibaca sp. MA1X17-3]
MAKVTEIKNDLDTQKKINAEMKRLNKFFEKIPKDKKGVVQSLIDSASFHTVILNKLEKHIAEHGTTSTYQNGANQWGKKRSPEVEVYNSMIKNHMGIIRQLTDLADKNHVEEDDGFDDFLKRRENF